MASVVGVVGLFGSAGGRTMGEVGEEGGGTGADSSTGLFALGGMQMACYLRVAGGDL